jgi:two-component system sensor histidine kinase KdpD
VLADATATLERLGVAHAISEARMRAQTDQLLLPHWWHG